jgi:hypothetical protein
MHISASIEPLAAARVEELRRERARPAPLTTFATIRARMQEQRRERAQVLAEARGSSMIHPRRYHRTANTRPSMSSIAPKAAARAYRDQTAKSPELVQNELYAHINGPRVNEAGITSSIAGRGREVFDNPY